MLVVEEKTPPVVDRDVPLLLQDWRLEADGTLAPFGQTAFAASSGRLGNALTINGRPTPETIEAAPGTRLRLRLANACNARATRIRFDGLKAWVAAVDGQPTDTFEPLRATLPFPPGTRYDILLDVPGIAEPAGAVVALIGAGMPLARIVAKGEPVAVRPAVAPIGENKLLPPEIKLQNAVRRDIAIAGGATFDKGKPEAAPVFTGDPTRIWTLNGAAGRAENPPLFTVKRNTAVVLALTNTTASRNRCTCTATSSGCSTRSTTVGSPTGSTRSSCWRAAPPESPSWPTIRGSGSSARRRSSDSIPACGAGSR